jgi:hypothetical protein
MPVDGKMTIEYAAAPMGAERRGRSWAWIVAGLVVCLADGVMWIAMFINPRLGTREALVIPCATIYLSSWLAAGVGIVLVCRSSKSARMWVALAVFVAVVLVNAYGFLYAISSMVG